MQLRQNHHLISSAKSSYKSDDDIIQDQEGRVKSLIEIFTHPTVWDPHHKRTCSRSLHHDQCNSGQLKVIQQCTLQLTQQANRQKQETNKDNAVEVAREASFFLILTSKFQHKSTLLGVDNFVQQLFLSLIHI